MVNVVVPVPPANGDPPVAAAYQSMVAPAAVVAVRVSVPVPQRDASVPVGAAGRANTLTVRVAVVLPQPVTL